MLKKIYIIAGESSGDFIGSRIIRMLKSSYGDVEFFGVGGDLMLKEGLNSLFHMREINFAGFSELITQIPRLLGLINKTSDDVISKQVDLVITIDSAGFCFRVAKKVKEKLERLKLVHVVAPSVWAFKKPKIGHIAKLYDHLFALFPFEPKIFKKHGLNTTFVGFPVFEQSFLNDISLTGQDINKLYSNKNLQLCVTPGSRVQEIKILAPIYIKAINILQKDIDIKICFLVQSNHCKEELKRHLFNAKIKNYFITENKEEAYLSSSIALAKSGTNILEIAASRIPLVVGYKLGWITYIILKTKIRSDLKFKTLINYLSSKLVTPELIQTSCNPSNIAKEIKMLIKDKNLALKQVKNNLKAIKKIGYGDSYGATNKIVDKLRSLYFK